LIDVEVVDNLLKGSAGGIIICISLKEIFATLSLSCWFDFYQTI